MFNLIAKYILQKKTVTTYLQLRPFKPTFKFFMTTNY